jgi:hypothetical protein
MNSCASMALAACPSRTLRITRSSIDDIADLAHSLSFDTIPSFQRRAGGETTELRGECPRWIIDVLDAISSARRISRTELVNEILARDAQQLLMEANVLARVARNNPDLLERAPSLSEGNR